MKLVLAFGILMHQYLQNYEIFTGAIPHLLSKQPMICRLASPMLAPLGGACVITGRAAIRGHRVEHYRSSEWGFGGGKSGVTSIRGFSSLLPRGAPLCCAPQRKMIPKCGAVLLQADLIFVTFNKPNIYVCRCLVRFPDPLVKWSELGNLTSRCPTMWKGFMCRKKQRWLIMG